MKICILISAAALVSGCSPPQIASDNLRLTMSLRTAVSARKPDWLTQNAELIESHREEGKLTDSEYAALRSIVDKAQSGAWEDAEKELVRLQKAQRPTAEQQSRAAADDS